MRSYSILSAVAALITVASAQYSIDPNTVSNATRQAWCTSQIAECPLICLQTAGNSAATDANNCDPTALTYDCVCSNGISPNVSMYSQTLPFYICQEWGNQCVSNCGSDSSCASTCRSDHPCGAQNPTRVNTSTITSSMSASASGSGTNVPAGATTGASGTVYTGFAGASSTGSGSAQSSAAAGSGAVAAIQFGQTFGLITVMASFFAGALLIL